MISYEVREVRSKACLSVFFFFPKKSEIAKIFWSMRRMIMGVGAFERYDLSGPSKYLDHGSLTHRKFFTGLWSYIISQNFDFRLRCDLKSWFKFSKKYPTRYVCTHRNRFRRPKSPKAGAFESSNVNKHSENLKHAFLTSKKFLKPI